MKLTLRTLQICLCWVLCSVVSGFFTHDSLAGQRDAGLPLPAKVVLAKAGGLMNQNAYDQALALLTSFQARGGVPTAVDAPDPRGYHHAEIYFALGTCHLLKESYQEAARALEQAVSRDPAHLAAWLNLARTAWALNDYTRAASCFARAYGLATPKNPEHLYYSAAAHLMAQQNPAAIAAFQRLFENHPGQIQPAWRENFVQALLAADRPLQALSHIRWLAQHQRGDKQIQWQEILLDQYLQLERNQDALDYAQWLTRQAPTRAKWWKALAHVHLQAGRYQPALTALTICSYLTPLSHEETQLLADLHLQLGIPVKAVPLYQSALGEAYDGRLLGRLMLALQQIGQPEAALEAFRRFAPQSRDPQLLMLKADLLYSLGHYPEAARAYRRTAQTDTPQQGRAWLMAGYAALQAEDVVASRSAFQQAAGFEQHRKAALLAIQRLPKMPQKPPQGQQQSSPQHLGAL